MSEEIDYGGFEMAAAAFEQFGQALEETMRVMARDLMPELEKILATAAEIRAYTEREAAKLGITVEEYIEFLRDVLRYIRGLQEAHERELWNQMLYKLAQVQREALGGE